MSLKEFDAADGHAQVDEAFPTLKPAEETFAMLALDMLVERTWQPRTIFDNGKLQQLADDIMARGIDTPILVRPIPASRLQDTFESRLPGAQLPTHEIVAGARRFRASKMAGRTTIPALIKSLNDVQAMESCLVENLQRVDLTELEEAEGFLELVESAGVRKEDIATKVNKSRTHVYARLKLLDLSSAPREALRSGEIDASKALLIARIPDEKLQIKALEAASEKDHQGSHRLSYRALQTWVQQNVMLKLSAARFSIVDASLVPAAGDCPSCSKRTGANPDLFADVDGPDVCTDPPCFHSKEAVHSEQLIAQARAKGMEVIEGKEALELRPFNYYSITGHRDLTSDIRGALSEREMKGKVKLFVDPHNGEVKEIIPADLAQRAVAKASKGERGGKLDKQMTKDRALQAEREAKQERRDLAQSYQDRWRTAAADTIAPRIRSGEIKTLSANLLRRVLHEMAMADNRCDEGTLFEVLQLKGDRYDDELMSSSIRSIDDNEVGYTLLLLLLEGDRTAKWDYVGDECVFDDSAPAMEELAGLLGISIDAIKADVQEQIRAERAPKAPAGDELAAQPEGSAKGEKSKSKPAAPARKGKTSKEEAAASIASALQQLDAGPAGGQDSAQEKPLPQVSDRVSVSDPADDRFEQQGVVMKVRASGKASVLFDVDQAEVPMPFDSLQVIAAALWPFPRDGGHQAEPAKATLKSGDRVRVRAAASGYASEHHGKEGKVKEPVDGTTQWIVNLAKPKKAPNLVELEADMLEVLA